jgi:hypothetical protein
MVCVYTLRCVQSPSRTAGDRRPALFPLYMQPHLLSKRQLIAIALMVDAGEKNSDMNDK